MSVARVYLIIVAANQTISLGLEIFIDHRSLSSIDQKLDGTGWDGMGLGWMVIIGHRSSKSTFGANERSPQRVSKMILLLQ